MNLRKIISRTRRAGFAVVVAGGVLYGGGCSLKGIGAGLLSEFLTSGGTSTVDSMLGSALSSALEGLLTPTDSSSTEETTDGSTDGSADEAEA